MLLTIDTTDPRPIYQQVADGIKTLIANGKLAEGAPLPQLRQLAADLGVNLNTIATAYRTLQDAGLIAVKHGSGAVVASLGLAWFADTGAYFAGRFLGKHKLYEAVSPKKTVEGAIGGLAASILSALVAHFWFLPVLPLGEGLVLALVGGGLGQAARVIADLHRDHTSTWRSYGS